MTQTTQTDSAVTRRVLEHHMTAFDAGDVEAILSDYAPDAVLFLPEGPVRGHAQLRQVFQQILAEVFTGEVEFRMLHEAVDGDVAYIVWSARTGRYDIPLGTDTFVVRGGKIVRQTFAAKMDRRG